MSVWLNYYSNRVLLIRDLGIMQLDENGSWIEMPLDKTLCLDEATLCELPPEVPQQWIEEAFDGEEIPEVESQSESKSLNYFSENHGNHERDYLKRASHTSYARPQGTSTTRTTVDTPRHNPNGYKGQGGLRSIPGDQSPRTQTHSGQSTDRKYMSFEQRNRGLDQTTDGTMQQKSENPNSIRQRSPLEYIGQRKPIREPTQPSHETNLTEGSRYIPPKSQPQVNSNNLRWAHRLQAPSTR